MPVALCVWGEYDCVLTGFIYFFLLISRDLAAWDVDFVIQMLQEFLRVSSAQTFPSLAEYRLLPDKVHLL